MGPDVGPLDGDAGGQQRQRGALELLEGDRLDVYRRYARLHLRLFPYLWSYLHALARDGRPIQRALGLAWPSSASTRRTSTSSATTCSCPGRRAGARTRALTLPPGDWVDWWTGARHGVRAADGRRPARDAPLFLRAGGLVPLLRPEIDTLNPTTAPSASTASPRPQAGSTW